MSQHLPASVLPVQRYRQAGCQHVQRAAAAGRRRGVPRCGDGGVDAAPQREFKPQMILISAGFDGHYEDDMGGLLLSRRTKNDHLKKLAAECATSALSPCSKAVT